MGKSEIERYVQSLTDAGMPEREIARAFFYADKYGLDALRGEFCDEFAEPKCGDWNCLNPEHQKLNVIAPRKQK